VRALIALDYWQETALMSQSAVDDIIHRASRLSQSEKQRIIAALSADAVGPPRRRVDPYGQFAHVSTSVDDFLFRKASEIELEDRRPGSGYLR
jgi:hypothetical protein